MLGLLLSHLDAAWSSVAAVLHDIFLLMTDVLATAWTAANAVLESFA